jgi:syntaxin 5
MKSRRRGLETTPISPQSQSANNVAVLEESKESEQESTLSLGIPMITQQQQQEMMVMEQDRYIDHRSSAIESIESTIAELGGIFQQLATMVAEQRETVQRYGKFKVSNMFLYLCFFFFFFFFFFIQNRLKY